MSPETDLVCGNRVTGCIGLKPCKGERAERPWWCRPGEADTRSRPPPGEEGGEWRSMFSLLWLMVTDAPVLERGERVYGEFWCDVGVGTSPSAETAGEKGETGWEMMGGGVVYAWSRGIGRPLVD